MNNKEELLDLIQIGAHIGDDHVSSLISRNLVSRCLLFEPIGNLFICCEGFYKDNPNIKVVQKAIVCDDTNSCTMFLPIDSEISWSNQLASIYEEHAATFGITEIEKQVVDALDASLLPDAKYLYIDTEGYDYDIIRKYLSSRTFRPQEIYFEHEHIKEPNYRQIIAQFGYTVKNIDHLNTLAVRDDITHSIFS